MAAICCPPWPVCPYHRCHFLSAVGLFCSQPISVPRSWLHKSTNQLHFRSWHSPGYASAFQLFVPRRTAQRQEPYQALSTNCPLPRKPDRNFEADLTYDVLSASYLIFQLPPAPDRSRPRLLLRSLPLCSSYRWLLFAFNPARTVRSVPSGPPSSFGSTTWRNV
jgi:hypothetical protein